MHIVLIRKKKPYPQPLPHREGSGMHRLLLERCSSTLSPRKVLYTLVSSPRKVLYTLVSSPRKVLYTLVSSPRKVYLCSISIY